MLFGILFVPSLALPITIEKHVDTEIFDQLISLLKILGLSTSLLCLMSISAAALAIKKLADKYQCTIRTKYDSLKHFPSITNGGSKLAAILGSLAPIGIPFIFVCVWGKLLIG